MKHLVSVKDALLNKLALSFERENCANCRHQTLFVHFFLNTTPVCVRSFLSVSKAVVIIKLKDKLFNLQFDLLLHAS